MIAYLTTGELAAILKTTEQTVSQKAKTGFFPGAIKLGNKWRFPPDVLERAAITEATPRIARPRKRRAA